MGPCPEEKIDGQNDTEKLGQTPATAEKKEERINKIQLPLDRKAPKRRIDPEQRVGMQVVNHEDMTPNLETVRPCPSQERRDAGQNESKEIRRVNAEKAADEIRPPET
jgi:hypothetical protein